MPSAARLKDFIATVVSNRHVEAIERFYAVDASTRENAQAPTVGKSAIIEREQKALARVTEVHTRPPVLVVAQGDHVVLQWIFEMTSADGVRRGLEELALQTWRDEEIISERFFYDSAVAWLPVDDGASSAAV